MTQDEKSNLILRKMMDIQKLIHEVCDLEVYLEREACAVICETYWNRPENGMSTEEEVCGSVTAELIRARGQA